MDIRPNTLEQFLFTDELAGSFGEVSKHAERLWRKVDGLRSRMKVVLPPDRVEKEES